LIIDLISLENGNLISSEVIDVPSKGVDWWKKKVDSTSSLRIVVKSHLNLARPVVFRSCVNSIDVFHG
jgi:hypothetical protein